MKKATGATRRKTWNRHIHYGDVLDDMAKIGGREFEEYNEIQQVWHHGGIEEEGVERGKQKRVSVPIYAKVWNGLVIISERKRWPQGTL